MLLSATTLKTMFVFHECERNQFLAALKEVIGIRHENGHVWDGRANRFTPAQSSCDYGSSETVNVPVTKNNTTTMFQVVSFFVIMASCESLRTSNCECDSAELMEQIVLL